MAQFRAMIKGNRGVASRLGTKKSGIYGSCNGWDIGIAFDIIHENAQDIVSVRLTGGSNNNHTIRELGTFSTKDLEGGVR